MSNRIIWTFRILAIPGMVVGILCLMDVMLPAAMTDIATVQSKDITHGKKFSYNIRAQGKFSYYESVSREFYYKTQVGMTLRISLTRFFKEWKSVDVIENGNVIFTGSGNDMFWLPLMGTAFLLASCWSFTDANNWFNPTKPTGIIIIGILELVAVLLFFKLILVWLGFAEKM